MRDASRRSASDFIGIGLLLIVFLVGVAVWIPSWWKGRERRYVYDGMIKVLKLPDCTDEGWWVADVAEQYRMGKIPRELAEADSAPLNPLVPSPIPFHGYFVRMMESAPPQKITSDEPVPLKGLKRAHAFAICFYPADPDSRNPAYISCDIGYFLRAGPWPNRSFGFPSRRELQAEWAIID